MLPKPIRIRLLTPLLTVAAGCSVAACQDMKDNAREWDAHRAELRINPKPDQRDLPRDPGDLSPVLDTHTREW